MKRMSADSRASYKSLGDDQKDPLPFQQWIEMPVPCRLPKRARHLEPLVWGYHPGGKESQMTA